MLADIKDKVFVVTGSSSGNRRRAWRWRWPISAPAWCFHGHHNVEGAEATKAEVEQRGRRGPAGHRRHPGCRYVSTA